MSQLQTWHVRARHSDLLNSLNLTRRHHPGTRQFSRSQKRYNQDNQSSEPQLPPFTSPAFRVTEPPDPSWRIGRGAGEGIGASSWKKDEEAGWKTWDLSDTPSRLAYRILTSALIPRPIAFVSSLSSEGIPNLAPFSYFSMVSHNPPLLSISFNLSPKKPKDTRENILATKEFVVNIVSEAFIEAANSASVEAPPDVNEWTWTGLTMEPSSEVRPARVRESAISFECKLYHSLNISPTKWADTTATLVLGRIQMVHIRNSVLTEDGLTVAPGKLRPIGRLGGTGFARIGEGFNIPRASWRHMRGEYFKYLRDIDGASAYRGED